MYAVEKIGPTMKAFNMQHNILICFLFIFTCVVFVLLMLNTADMAESRLRISELEREVAVIQAGE